MDNSPLFQRVCDFSDNTAINSGTVPLFRGGMCPQVYYDPKCSLLSLQDLVGASDTMVNMLSPACVAALRVIISYSMRSVEYLRLTTDDVLQRDRVIVKGAKGSRSYSLILHGVSKFAREAGHASLTRSLSGLSYSHLYRACIKAQIGDRITGHCNVARTHIGRYQIANDGASRSARAVLGDCLRHRSAKTINYYVSTGV
jgi:hypothetical protein